MTAQPLHAHVPRYAARATLVTPSAAASDPPGMIMFASGDAHPESLPDVSEFAHRAAVTYRTETLQYAPRFGLLDLREWIARHVERDGIRVEADSILVVYGAKQGLDLVAKLFLDPGDTIVVTRPTYQSALAIFRGWQVEFLEVGLDRDGMQVDALATLLTERARRGLAAPKLVYDVPEFHNPTGVTLARARREALVDLAARHGMLVVEDDPYRRIRFAGEPVPPIQAFDPGRHVIGLGTFAKLVAPGLRVGWVVAAPEIVARLAALKADGGSSAFMQRVLLEYCRAGRLDPDVRDRVRTYQAHRDVMARAVREQMPEVRFDLPDGGYYLWLRLPEAMDGDRLAASAEAHGVRVLPSSHFHATPGPGNHVRLAYSHASPSEIVEGVRRLASAFKDVNVLG
jgi:2-aminoadipate transaminase